MPYDQPLICTDENSKAGIRTLLAALENAEITVRKMVDEDGVGWTLVTLFTPDLTLSLLGTVAHGPGGAWFADLSIEDRSGEVARHGVAWEDWTILSNALVMAHGEAIRRADLASATEL